MKCPKCHYLGFETGDRCKNCGYDFSLLSVAESEPADYEIHPPAIDDVPVHVVDRIAREDDRELEHDSGLSIRDEIDEPAGGLTMSLASDVPLDERDQSIHDLPLVPPTLSEPSAERSESPVPLVPFLSAMPTANERVPPLFKRRQKDDDEPLIKLPAAPRPPLAVRRTPDTPRLRAVPRSMLRPAAPVLQFSDEAADRTVPPEEEQKTASLQRRSSVVCREESRAAARIAAVAIDYLILLGIDAAVVYFTLRIAGLSMQEWTTLPIAPMVAFLGLLKLSYFGAFTAVGGQTIGKMALGTCVVSESGKPIDAALALRRTSAGILSFLLFGVGFIPALFGDRRALHDRLTGTRVVRLRSV